jgi:hypothetical protein
MTSKWSEMPSEALTRVSVAQIHNIMGTQGYQKAAKHGY